MTNLPCKDLFGEARGAEIIELVERVTGAPCPCSQGRQCPLLPDAMVPKPRSEAGVLAPSTT